MASCLAGVVDKGPRTLVLNLSETTFMDCAGFNVIVEAKRQLPAESTVVLHQPKPFIRQLFAILEIDTFCAVAPSLA
jgi:anti-anti-sigma factor